MTIILRIIFYTTLILFCLGVIFWDEIQDMMNYGIKKNDTDECPCGCNKEMRL